MTVVLQHIGHWGYEDLLGDEKVSCGAAVEEAKAKELEKKEAQDA